MVKCKEEKEAQVGFCGHPVPAQTCWLHRTSRMVTALTHRHTTSHARLASLVLLGESAHHHIYIHHPSCLYIESHGVVPIIHMHTSAHPKGTHPMLLTRISVVHSHLLGLQLCWRTTTPCGLECLFYGFVTACNPLLGHVPSDSKQKPYHRKE